MVKLVDAARSERAGANISVPVQLRPPVPGNARMVESVDTPASKAGTLGCARSTRAARIGSVVELADASDLKSDALGHARSTRAGATISRG